MILTLNLQIMLVRGYGLGMERQVCLCLEMSRDKKHDRFYAHLHSTQKGSIEKGPNPITISLLEYIFLNLLLGYEGSCQSQSPSHKYVTACF